MEAGAQGAVGGPHHGEPLGMGVIRLQGEPLQRVFAVRRLDGAVDGAGRDAVDVAGLEVLHPYPADLLGPVGVAAGHRREPVAEHELMAPAVVLPGVASVVDLDGVGPGQHLSHEFRSAAEFVPEDPAPAPVRVGEDHPPALVTDGIEEAGKAALEDHPPQTHADDVGPVVTGELAAHHHPQARRRRRRQRHRTLDGVVIGHAHHGEPGGQRALDHLGVARARVVGSPGVEVVVDPDRQVSRPPCPPRGSMATATAARPLARTGADPGRGPASGKGVLRRPSRYRLPPGLGGGV